MELLFKRKEHLLSAVRKNPRLLDVPKGIDWSMQEVIDDSFPYHRSHPDIEAKALERGMAEYNPYVIPSQKLWTWNYDSKERLKMTTYRLGALVYYRENTVLPYLASIENHPNSTRRDDIEESSDFAISVAIKSVVKELLLLRRKKSDLYKYLSSYDINHFSEIRKALFEKTKRFKEDTEDFIKKSQCEIKEAEVRNQAAGKRAA